MIFRAVSLRLMILGLLAGAVGPGSRSATASEVCHFAGDTDYSGHVEVTTDVTVADAVTTVDVVVTFDAITMFVIPIRYLVEEVSRWRAGVLDSVAANTRYLVGGQIVRQQWDVFQRGPEGLQAYRVQAKTLE